MKSRILDTLLVIGTALAALAVPAVLASAILLMFIP